MIGMSIAGDEGLFNQTERTLLSSSLPPMLERMSVSAAERTANLLYPICIGFAAVSYGRRIYQVQQTRKEVSMPDVQPSQNGTNEPQENKNTGSLNPFYRNN